MFHQYLQPACHAGRPEGARLVDIDHATFLMDKALFQQTLSAVRKARSEDPEQWDKLDFAQWCWATYCERHLAKYGQPFEPDVNPRWDL